MKLALKFTLVFVLGMSAVLGVEAYFTCEREIAASRADIAHDQHVLGESLALSAGRLWQSSGREAAMDFVREADRAESRSGVRVAWIPLNAGADEAATRIPTAELEGLRGGRETHWLDLRAVPGGQSFTCVPLRIAGGIPGAVQITESLADERAQIRSIVRGVVLATIEVVAVCGVLALTLGMRFVGRPVGALIRQARAIAAGDLSGDLHFHRHDEFQILADEIDAMRGRLSISQRRIQSEHASRIAAIEQLRHADRLKTVGQLASGVAHELGTPLTVVDARAKLLQSPQFGQTVVDSARVIGEQAGRMTQIIRQLLNLARPHRSRRAVVALDDIARRTLALLEAFARAHNVRLALHSDGTAVACVDPDQIQQVLSNLIVNGVQAMPEGGTLEVIISRRRARPPADMGGAEAEYFRVSVQDTGVGIAPDVMPRLFEPFFTTKDVGTGTGLGLSVSRGLVREHGGWIDVSSVPGRGSRFDVYLPPAPSQHGDDRPGADSADRARRRQELKSGPAHSSPEVPPEGRFAQENGHVDRQDSAVGRAGGNGGGVGRICRTDEAGRPEQPQAAHPAGRG